MSIIGFNIGALGKPVYKYPYGTSGGGGVAGCRRGREHEDVGRDGDARGGAVRQDGSGASVAGPGCRPGHPGLAAEHGARSSGTVPATRHSGHHRGDKKAQVFLRRGERRGQRELAADPGAGERFTGQPLRECSSGDDLSSAEGTSPTQWQFYHKPRDDDRRVSGTSVVSLGSDNGLYQTPPVPRGTMEGSFVSEDLSLTLPTGYGGGRESDQLSVSSSSSVGGPSPRDRRCLPNDSSAAGIYLPMAPLSSSLHSPASNSKVSPTPPKKPPRRNLSVSPTHLQTQMSLSADCTLGPSNYEYLFMARSGARSHIDLEQLQKRREQLRHVTRSVDQYVEMKSRVPDGEEKREPNVEPVAITSIYENRPIKTLNPRRKLRRHAFESYEPESSPCADKSPCSETDSFVQEPTFVSNAFLTLKSSQESLLDDKRDAVDEHPTPEGREATDKRLKRVQMMLPTSPTHYAQPPTPDHPPPSAMQAEKSIHERIRPLSQTPQHRSVDRFEQHSDQ
ncbi:hypothetical protein K0M31_018941 [Melipona bicolor]|uniref:Uncharacterized protein n=1 Tax=Melipona bicolor TaxID=60889 RepID=A0AA40KDV6_9HYME|nr:hypothetical protein K0M31_018941 [Melipona bicolor]